MTRLVVSCGIVGHDKTACKHRVQVVSELCVAYHCPHVRGAVRPCRLELSMVLYRPPLRQPTFEVISTPCWQLRKDAEW